MNQEKEKIILDEWARNNHWKGFKEFAENRQGITNPRELIQETVKAIFSDLINDTDNKGVIEWLKHKQKKWCKE